MKQWHSYIFSPPSMRPGPGPPPLNNASCPLQKRLQAHCSLRSGIAALTLANTRLKRELESLRKGRSVPSPAIPPKQVNRLEQLEEAVRNLDAAQPMQEVQQSLERIWREMEPDTGGEELRSLVVETMRLSLDLWLEATRTSKAELARRSRQWSVYINDNGWERTQGLDRYLDCVTLPKNPRVKKVLRTGDFVLGACHEPAPLYDRLRNTLKRLRSLQATDG